MLTKQDLFDIKNLLQPINNKLTEHDKQFKVINKKLNKLQTDLDVTIDFFDDYRLKHEKRLEMVEKHLIC